MKLINKMCKSIPVLGFTLLGATLWIDQSNAEVKNCSCKCVFKGERGEYSMMEGMGKDRKSAGEDLKKKLHPGTCELTPECKGSCALDE